MMKLIIASLVVVVSVINFGIQADLTSGAQNFFRVYFSLKGERFQCIIPSSFTGSVQLSTLYAFNAHFARWLTTADCKNVTGFGKHMRLPSCTRGTNNVDHLC